MTCTLMVRPSGLCERLVVEPDCVNIAFPYGTDNELVAIIKDSDGKALPINTDTVTLTVKDGRGGNLIFEKIKTPGLHSNPDQGETIFAIASTDIASADPYIVTSWRYELRRETAGGSVYCHVAGLFIVEPTI